MKFKDLNIGDKFNFKSYIFTKTDKDRAMTKINEIVTWFYIFKANDLISK